MTTPEHAPAGTPAGATDPATGPADETVVVVAVLTIAPGRLDDALEIVRANVPTVHAEDGCLTYAVNAARDPDRIVFVERWSTPDALAAHGASVHMKATNVAMADLVTGPSELILAGSVPMGTAEQGVF